MQLKILGMEGPFPGPCGGTSGYFLSGNGFKIQFDIGSGVLSKLTAFFPPEQLDALVVSHWHYDHICDILPLLYRLQSTSGCRKLDVYGPEDEFSPIMQSVSASPYVSLHIVAPGDELIIGNAKLRFWKANHPVPALMTELIGEGKKFCYTGDTNLCTGLVEFAQNADLLLADGLFTEDMWDESKPHLSAAKAAQLGRDADVKQLIITHLNPFIDKTTLLNEAREKYRAAKLAKCMDCCII